VLGLWRRALAISTGAAGPREQNWEQYEQYWTPSSWRVDRRSDTFRDDPYNF
jgi:hypothetical protein